MTDLEIRALEPDDYRAAHTLFRGTLLYPPAGDEEWVRAAGTYEGARMLGAFRDGRMVGTVQSFASRLVVPGGVVVPVALVTRVGVAADHTRRGVLTALKRAQLSGMSEPVATLRASEGLIYGRFGYGVATRGRTVVVRRGRAVLHPGVPAEGRVRMVTAAEGVGLVRDLYERFGPGRPGWVDRMPFWWHGVRVEVERSRDYDMVAVHTGPDGDDGFAGYTVTRRGDDHDRRRIMDVNDLVASTPAAWAGLWRFLLGVDLVDEVRAVLRPLDEPLELLFTDRRVVEQVDVEDETWLRLVDVPAMLAAREFGVLAGGRAGSLVVDVVDDLLPTNAGRYRIGDGPARRVDEPADIALDVAALGALYLGDVSASALARAARLVVCTPGALPVADRLFAVPESPHCGTYF